MQSKRKVWNRFGELIVVGAVISAGSLANATNLPVGVRNALHQATPAGLFAEGEGASATATAPAKTAVVSSEGGEGGEGEGTAQPASAVTDDIVYLNLLGQVRGHLRVGVALYNAGAHPMALMHMKHPGDELYAAIKPALDARHASDFATPLSALSSTVERQGTQAEVAAALAQLELALNKSASVVDTRSIAGTKTLLGAVHALVKTAADEYAEGVKDGKVVNGHEYQDAWGFTTSANALLASLSDEQRSAAVSNVAEIQAQIDVLLASAWPSVVPPESISTDAALLYGAAARIELASHALR
ncbi:MAG: hypothetical protein ACT4NL_16625 [Pseudomarimonas sp.]